MATRVFLIRHGATVLTAEDRFAGETNVELSDAGRDQLRKLSQRLANEPIEAFYASPMNRTVETCKIIASPHNKGIELRDGLREISHGRWEQRTRSEVEKSFPEEYSLWEADPYTFAPEGGETGLEVTARALPVIKEVVRSHPGKTVCVVSHKATIRLLLSLLLGFDPRSYRDRLEQNPACLNILDFKDASRARLVLFNDISHYAYTSSATPDIPRNRLSKWWDNASDLLPE